MVICAYDSFDERLSEMTAEERLLRLENAFATLGELSRNMDGRMDDSNARMDEFDKRLAALVEAKGRTEENLNSLIVTVERVISEGRNGKS
jgi:predicted  nucleic acid-binding Zn-ribbon protein